METAGEYAHTVRLVVIHRLKQFLLAIHNKWDIAGNGLSDEVILSHFGKLIQSWKPCSVSTSRYKR